MNIYVGNLNYGLTEPELKQAFEAHGQVSSVKIITDKFTGKAKGFAFVEMPNDTEARNAISQMNGADLKGRPLKVSEARSKDQ
jgi:RNA recognition motif-containing protein